MVANSDFEVRFVLGARVGVGGRLVVSENCRYSTLWAAAEGLVEGWRCGDFPIFAHCPAVVRRLCAESPRSEVGLFGYTEVRSGGRVPWLVPCLGYWASHTVESGEVWATPAGYVCVPGLERDYAREVALRPRLEPWAASWFGGCDPWCGPLPLVGSCPGGVAGGAE